MKNDKLRGLLIWLALTAFLCALGLGAYVALDKGGFLSSLILSLVDAPAATIRWDQAHWLRLAALGIMGLACALFSAAVVLTARWAARWQRDRQIRLMAQFVEQLARGGEPQAHLPDGYADVERPILAMQRQGARAQRMAQAEMQRKSDLITYLAHDLKTPLASVIAYLNLLNEAPDLPAPQRAKYLGIAQDKAYRLEQLIGELFEIIRFNLQTISLDRRDIPLKFMLEQLADEFYPLLLPGGRTVKVDCPQDMVVSADPDKLARVFNNILKNAAAYSFENTQIDVRARREADGVEITFSNQGNPIPPEKQAAIFEKFYRLDEARSTRTGGAGLGLAIAKEIIDAHGGQIAVSSAAQRTVFTVHLPLPPQAQEPS